MHRLRCLFKYFLNILVHKERIELKYEGIAVCLAIRDDATKPNLGKNQIGSS